MPTSRRGFFKLSAATAAMTSPAMLKAAKQTAHRVEQADRVDVMRRPDRVDARLRSGEMVSLAYASGAWARVGVWVRAEPETRGSEVELPVSVRSSDDQLSYLHLRWEGRGAADALFLGDAWERSYGDLAWQSYVPQRVMPWYFLAYQGGVVRGYGVRTQPGALCFWQSETNGVSLWLDVRSGGEPAQFGDRELKACTVVTYAGEAGEPIASAAHVFCRKMCSSPRLPRFPIFGSNDWNYAYGRNTASGILRDADLMVSLAPKSGVRPLVVIDDGWQDKARFPDLPGLATQLKTRNARPGLWIRPLRAPASTPSAWLLPSSRFGANAAGAARAFDPTVPEAFQAVMDSIRTPVAWGYEFIKHDFSTFELLGRWGSEMGPEPTADGWHFHDRTRTTAEILTDLYRALRQAAGEEVTILGCNTMGHLAAGIFESQRIGDDTSGRDWERTRRFGVNSLAHRVAQHRAFFHVDPDIVAVTRDVSWKDTSQWMDLVARSGTSLFVAPAPDAVSAEVRSAIREAFAIVSEGSGGYPMDPMHSTTPERWEFESPLRKEVTYDWSGVDGVCPFLRA